MKITVAIDSFKGSISSLEAGEAVERAALSVFPDANVSVIPLADGGEGTVAAIHYAVGGTIHKLSVKGPLGDRVNAEYCILPSGVAVIEMASAAGITLIQQDKRDPKIATTYGVGELILDAISRGCRKFVVGIGGSATNDGGAGMLSALGYKLLNKHGEHIPLGAIGLSELDKIIKTSVSPELSECEFTVACDVKNPLIGPNGASCVFGPQKGADSNDVVILDKCLEHFSDIVLKTFCKDHSYTEGAGAAGGLGFAFISFLGAKLTSGISLVTDYLGLEEHIKCSDLVITGEGRLDSQSSMGKAPIGVASIAKKYDKPVVAFAGSVSSDASVCNNFGIDAFFSIAQGACSLTEAMDKHNATRNLQHTAEQALRLFAVSSKI